MVLLMQHLTLTRIPMTSLNHTSGHNFCRHPLTTCEPQRQTAGRVNEADSYLVSAKSGDNLLDFWKVKAM